MIPIPLIEAGRAGPIVLIEEEPERLQDLVSCARNHYGDLVLRLGDRISKRWLARSHNPYLSEMAAVAELALPVGAYLLNTSYEWACTSGAGPDPAGTGNRLLRTLDWPLCGLGRNLVVAHLEAGAGDYYDVTWPGYSGTLTAMAPGRFSGSLNQPPMRRVTFLFPLDWALARLRVQTRRDLPPAHLLRRVFETCRDYGEARDMLMGTPVCIPAFFTLSGLRPGECCVIERTEDEAWVRDGPGAVANHWRERPRAGHSRGWDSAGRLAAMEGCLAEETPGGFGWVAPPMLNPTTRVAVEANAALGSLRVRGYEKDGPATADFVL